MNDTVKIEKYFDREFASEANNYKNIIGPSYLNGLPDPEEWHIFLKSIEDPITKEFAEVWQDKAKAAKGVPLRSDFDFQNLVKYGKYLTIYKRTEEGYWLTTYCGIGIAEELKLELSNKYIHEYADEDILEYWMANIQQITECCKPIVEYYALEYTNQHHKTSQTLNLPLRSGASDSVDMFICYEYFSYVQHS